MYPPVLRGVYASIEAVFRQSGVIAGKSGRHMKFPYTISAKMAQFPFFYHIKHNFICMYLPPAATIAFYFIVQIHNLVNSEANVKSWAETQRKIAEKEHGH